MNWELFFMAIFLVLFLLAFIFIPVWQGTKASKEQKKLLQNSVIPYRDYEKEIHDILVEDEKERQNLPCVTLWWGLDGLRLNRDGTTEWICKKPKKAEKYWTGPDLVHSYPIPEYPLGFAGLYQPILYGFNCQNSTPEDRISFLENEQYRLQMAQAQGYQTRAILDALNSCELVDILGNTYTEQIR